MHTQVKDVNMVVGDYYVAVLLKDNKVLELTVQEQDGTVLFSGNPVQAHNLSEVIVEVLQYDFKFNERGSNGLEDDRQEVA